jgi:hypothetical protein
MSRATTFEEWSAMSSQQKRGFRLPWGTERPDDGDASLDTTAAESSTDGGSDDLGEGPFGLADDAQSTTTDAAPAAADAQDKTPEAAMIDADAPTTESAAAPPEKSAEDGGAWPNADRRGADRRVAERRAADRRGADRPFMINPAAGESRLPRRDNPLVAGLVKAMREAALASRSETTDRLAAEATARVEAIRTRATTEAADLKKQADEDVSAIRDWSKAEMARVRQRTEERIDERKSELAAETERHAATVDRLVDEVETTVAAFEADMDRFFEELLAESDPARLATLAEQAPDPPDLTGDGPTAGEYEAEAQADPGLHADDAAEAEAEASEGLDLRDIEAWTASGPAAGRGGDSATSPTEPNGPDSTRLLVTGLTSVASISTFKGALAQLPGVRSVSVSSGKPGVFVFSVNHDPGVDLDSGVASLPAFGARVTDATNDGFTVVAQEPAA